MVKTIANRLKTFKEKTGMSQYDIAESLGIRQSTVSRWERGTSEPQGLYLQSLERMMARALKKVEAL